MWVALSSPFLFGSGIDVSVPCLIAMQVLWWCPSMPCHLLLQSHLWMTSIAVGLSAPQLVDGQPQDMGSDSIHMCSSSSVANLISALSYGQVSPCMPQSAMMVMPLPGISSYLFVLCLHPPISDEQLWPGFYSILMLYWWIHE